MNDKAGERGLSGDGPAARAVCFLGLVFSGIRSNRFQQSITLATMALGSLALSMTIFVGGGAYQGLWSDFEHLMGKWVIVYSEAGPDRKILKTRPEEYLTGGDLACVRNRTRRAKYVAPFYSGRVAVSFQGKAHIMSVDGIEEQLEKEKMFIPYQGRPFSKEARQGLARETLLTKSAAELLGVRLSENPIVRIDREFFHVVGLIPDPPGADKRFRARAATTYFTAHSLWGRPGYVDNILVSSPGPEEMDRVVEELGRALDRCRGEETYWFSSSSFKIKKAKSLVRTFMIYGLGQAGLIILIASVGIFNVMLTTVNQRAGEFALRITFGARQGDILSMVLAQSILLGIIGALVGSALACLTAPWAAAFLSSRLPDAAVVRPALDPAGFLIPLAVCGISGLLAGLIPALKARRIDILEVLRQ